MATRPKQRRWLYPIGAERDYLAALRREVVRPLEEGTRRFIFPVLDRAYDRQDADPRDLPYTTGWFEELRVALLATLAHAGLGEPVIRAILQRIGTTVSTFNRKEFHAVMRSVYRVDVITGDPVLTAVLEQFEAQNIALVKSIPQQSLSRMEGMITEAVRRGQTVQALKGRIKEEFGVADRRAALIARDQIGKLNGQLTYERQKAVGVESYRWRGVLDARERPEHVAREGKVFQWDSPPDDGHPGEPINCRCIAEPVLPSWEEMEKRLTGAVVAPGTYE